MVQFETRRAEAGAVGVAEVLGLWFERRGAVRDTKYTKMYHKKDKNLFQALPDVPGAC